MIFQHQRFQIWNSSQHPYKHSLDDLAYSNEAMPGVSGLGSALDYLVAVLYPQSQPAVADVASLPAAGNTINDMRVVSDDGDGKAASYRWEQREGDVAAKWYKIYDLDWGTDSILQQFMLKTQDIYVKQYGYDDLDSSGTPIAGSLAGQRIYGGASASTHLTLYANSGDGTGTQTGFVQFGDNVRPITDSAFDFGTTSERWQKIWTDAIESGTLLATSGSITDSSGAIDFGDENLSTTGSLTAGNITISGDDIVSSSGQVDFADENLTTTGTVTANSVTATGAASSFATATTVGNLTLANGSITDSSGTISFGDENLTSTGTGTFSRVTGGNIRISANEIRALNVNGSIGVYADGTGTIDFNSPTRVVSASFDVTSGNATFTQSVVAISGVGARLDVDNVQIDGNTIATLDANGDLIIAPNGSGLISTSGIFPTTDSVSDLGKSGNVWNSLWLDGSVTDGTSAILATELLALRNIFFRDAARTQAAQAGDALFYDGVSGTYLASVPDSEIAHADLSGLVAGDGGHTQFAMLAGRAGGQTIQGGTVGFQNLTLESTSHASKGSIIAKDRVRPFAAPVYAAGWTGTDLGSGGAGWNDIYSKGEHIGLRLENVGANPSASAQNVGRLVYNTADATAYVDTGTAMSRLGSKRHEVDTSWDGIVTTKVVSGITSVDCTKAIWQLKNNGVDFETMQVPIKATSTSEVTITLGYPLPAGTYRLIGME